MKERQPSRKDAILVSICCITYNHEEFIRDCIEGFLMQGTDFPMEIIIHDDASTDRTPEIVREYAAKYPDLIFPIFQKENQFSKGRKPLINLTLPHAKGKYIAVCEGDDYWTDPHKLRKQVDFLESHPDYISCYHDAMIVDEDGNIVKPSKLPDNFKKDFSPEEISKGAWILTLTQCFRNVLKNIPSEVEHVYNGDTFFNSLLGNFGRGKYMADIAPAVYRLHPNSIWSILDESDKMYHGGVTRAWMYRYYKRIGQHQYAEHYKNLAIEHFCRMLKILAPNHGAQHNDIINNISNQFADIIEGTSGSNLRKLLKRTQFLTGIENKEAPAMSSFSHESPSQQQTSIDGPGNSDKKINRILFVNHNIYPYEVSGTPLTTLNHAVGMAQRGFEVAVLIPSPKVKKGFTKDSSSDFNLYQVPAMDKFDAYFSAIDEDSQSRYMETIEGIIDDFSPQIVHINDYVYMPSEIIEVFSRKGCIVVREVCNCEELCHRDYPVIASGLNGQLCTGPEKPNKCAKCFQTLSASATRKHNRKETARSIADKIETRFEHVRRLYQDAVDKVLFTSEPFKNYFTQFVPVAENKIAVIPRGFQFDYTRRVNHERETGDAIHFAFIGNIMFSKGIDVVLKAFEKIVGEYRNFVLHLYGNIVNPEYRQWIGKLQSSFPNRLINHGPFNKDSLPTIADGIDVCIIPSYFDTYNRVLREILYLGIPVIVTDFFGAYIVEDGKNGFKIPIGDDEALAQKMADIIDNPSMIKHLSRGAENTQIPSLEQEIDQLVETYNDLYNQSPRARCLQRAKSIKTVESQGSHIDTATRLIAFYLPQYHPIPENDRWWGKGFTEWTNTAKAKPLFPGHYQPHVPSELGYYDLRLAETRNAQAELAREHGISGFCYYHYWFNGKLLLDYPLDQVLKTGEPDFPFCLCWANENWTRAWDGQDRDILIQQNYSTQDDLDHIRHLCGIFRDTRYIRVDGRPLFIVYRASNLPDPLATTTLWREEARRLGIGDLFLCRVERFVQDMTDPRSLGFDAAIEFQPDGIHLGTPREDMKHTGYHVYDYHNLIRAALSKSGPDYPRFPCVCPSWDNSPRRKKGAIIFHESTPQLYELWLKEILARLLQSQAKERMVFINAFNEWGEGCHLEPDHKFGRAYLEATHRAVLFANDFGQARQPHSATGAKVEPKMPGEVQPSSVTGESTCAESRVSIVIPVFNKVEFTRKCIETLFSSTPPGTFECIIVDNGSTDGTREYLKGLGDRVKVITNPENLGFARACNQGAQAASSPYVLFLNNDTEPRPGWLAALVAVLDSDPAVAAAGSKMLFPDGTIQHAGVLIIDDKKLPDPLVGRHIYYGLPADCREANVSRTYQALTAGCLLVRRNLFEEVGMFDEGYWNGYEDLDLCFKIQDKGWILVYQPESVLIHHESKSGPERFTKVRENIQRLHEKWIGRITPDAVIEEDGALLWTDARRIRFYRAPGTQGEHDSARQPEAIKDPVSIVILSFNGLEYTKQCVQSIQEHTPEPHEIIFVDNGSTDGTVQWLRTLAEEHSNYRLIENEHNLGFARGCNQGIEAAEGAYILLLNNDVIVTQGWLSCMLRHLNSSDDIGMVGPMSNSVSGPQLVEKVPYGSSMDAMQKFARNRSSRYSGETTEHMRLVGFCLLVKKEVLDIIGGLDENYNSGNFEDDDLCLRSFVAGYKNIIAHDVFIHHFGSMTFKGNAIDYQASMNDNLKYFSGKWKGFAEASENGYRITLTRQQQLGLLLQWGEERFSQGDMHAAIKIFKRVLLLDRKNSQALNNLGVIQWQLGDMPASLDTFQVALRINPEDSDALGNLVQGVIETERFDLLQQDLLDTLRQKHPAHPDVVRLFTAQQNAAGAT